MEKREQLNAMLWIALLYTVITSAFEIITSTMKSIYDLYFKNSQIGDSLKSFFGVNGLSIIVTVILVIVLIINIKKSNQISYLEILDKETVFFTTGILIIIQGLIKLSISLPFFITMIQEPELTGMWDKEGLIITIISYAIPIIVIICQLLLGIYLTKYAKKKTVDNTALWIALLLTVITNIFTLINRIILALSSIVKNNNIVTELSVRIFLWIVVVAIIVIILTLKIKKSTQTSGLNILEKQGVGLVTGVLIVIKGLIDLSTVLSNILYLTFSQAQGVQGVFKDVLILYEISVAILLCQIFLGVYLVKYYKNKIT